MRWRGAETNHWLSWLPAVAVLGGGVFGLACTIFAFITGVEWPAYPGLWLPKFVGEDVYGFVVWLAVGNVISYSLLFWIGGFIWTRFIFWREDVAKENTPECPVCGHKWAVPTRSQCPKCNQALAFAGQVRGSKRCRHCTYDLTGNVSGVCPECGEQV